MFTNTSPESILYIVEISCPDQEIADAVLTWLYDEHLEDVCQYAEEAQAYGRILEYPEPEIDDDFEPVVVTAVYRFKDRACLTHYLNAGAAEMREKGLDAFPPEVGLTFKRSAQQYVDIDL